MDQIEELVTLLYSPGSSPELLYKAQRSLQQAQKSADGWKLAHSLLSSANPQSQFLGAQTFIVKINDGFDLPTRETQHEDLLGWLNTAVTCRFAPFVTRKLLGAVTKLYLSNDDWPQCPFEVVRIIGSNSELVFEFLNYLVEDSELAANDLRKKLVPEVSNLVIDLLKQSQMSTISSIKTLEFWALIFFDQFKDLVSALATQVTGLFQTIDLTANDSNDAKTDELLATMLNTISNLYSHNWKCWPPLTRHRLTDSLKAITLLYPIVPPLEFAENELFISLTRLIITVCQEDFESNSELHQFLAKVAAAEVPVIDDPLATETLEFWNQYAEEIISSGLSTSNNSGSAQLLSSVISGYWPRIKLYPQLRASDWDEFCSFRKDFADFLELSYPIMGSQLFDQLTNVVISSLDGTSAGLGVDWLSVESGLFCLNGLSDIIGDDFRGEKPEFASVQRIFQSDLWTMVHQCDNNRVRQTVVNLIGCFVDFFLSAEGQPYLAVTLNYLFTCLDSITLQNNASRSIQKICDTCQTSLTAEIPAFLSIYSRIRSELRSIPHVRTVGGIACVIQALDNLEDKAAAIDQLLKLISTAEPIFDVTPVEVQQTLLKCVAIVGKKVQSVEIALPGGSSSGNKTSAIHFWDTNPTSLGIKQYLQTTIRAMVESSDVTSVEAVCDIVKAGIAEGKGPFYLDNQFVISFIVAKCQAGPPLTATPVLDLARFYIMSRLASVRQNTGPNLTPEEIAVLVSVGNQQGESLTSAALDLLSQIVMVSHTMQVSFTQLAPGTQASVEIALSSLKSGDRFVLRSAANFWKELLNVPVTTAKGTDSIDYRIFESLIRVLLTQFSGDASRSDIGPLNEILKVLISKHPLISSQLLKHYVVDAPQDSTVKRQDPKTRSDFVAQLVLLKGGRKTLDVVQRFWLKCRGIPDTYNPHGKAIIIE